MKIFCTGSIAFDYLMTFPGYFKDSIVQEKLESISISFLVDTLIRQYGGVAPNIAYNLALLGETPYIFGTAGADFKEYRQYLEQKGIITKYVKEIPDKFTSSFFANTDQSNAQIASFYSGAMAHAAELSIKDILGEKPDLILISPNSPDAMDKYINECVELGIPYLYDPSQQLARISAESINLGIKNAQSLFVNDYEFELIKKHTGITEDKLISDIDLVVVTRGNHGTTIFTEGKEYKIPVVEPKEIKDPTGVGDAFRGGFLKGMSAGFDWETCGKMGALTATYCLEQKGTQNHNFTMEEFIKRYRENFDDQGKLNALLS